jgi:hypothetical protein
MKVLLSLTRRDLKVFIACLLSFSLLTMPFVPVAAAASRGMERRARVSDDKSSEAKATVNFANAPQPAPAPQPFVATITATKAGAILGDDGDNKADPATSPNPEKIEYTVTITNTGTTNATNVVFTDTIDAHTTLVNGSITTQPIAVNDTFSAIGNTRITVPDGANDLLGNDCDPDPNGGPCTNAGLTVSVLAGDNTAPFAGTTAQGGNVTATTGDGSFQYNPAPGFEGPDSFTYTVIDATGKTDTATVNITVSGMIWFVNAAAPAGGDGRLTNPFNCLAGAGSCFSGTTADEPGDFIFLFSGTYNDTIALALLNNQKLIGAAATAPLAGPGSITGFTIPTFSDTLPPTSQASPVITSTVSGIQLATGNLLRGFTVGNTSTAASNYDILNTATATVGTLTVLEVILNGTGGLLRADSGGTLNVTFASASTTSAGSNGVHLGNTSGSVVIGAGGTITGVAGADVLINAGTVSLTCSGNITHAVGVNPMVNITGGHSTGIVTFNTGTLNASSGTGLVFDNADSTYNFNGTTTLAGGDAGIDVLNGSQGTFNFNGTTITNPSGVALNVSASSGAISISGAISKNTDGKMIDFDNYDTGTATISGNLSCTSICDGVEVTNDGTSSGTVNFSGATKTLNTGASTAVNLDNNDSGNVNFTGGGLDIDTTSGSGFNAVDGGTVTVTTGTNNNTIDTTTGTGLNFNTTNIGAAGLTFRSISVNGAASGIVLNTTGALGGLTVTGGGNTSQGGDNSGGQIQNTTSHGVSLNNTSNVSFTNLRINNTGDQGINGTLVTNFSFTFGTINNAGNGADESSISFDDGAKNITGTFTVTNSNLTLTDASGIDVEQSDGALTNVVISTNTITSELGVTDPTPGSAVKLICNATTTTACSMPKATISANTIGSATNSFNEAGFVIQANTVDNVASQSATLGIAGDAANVINVTGNFMNGGGNGTLADIGFQADRFITAALNGKGTSNFNISNNGTLANPIKNIDGVGIELSNFGAGTMSASISSNFLSVNNGVASAGIGVGCDADSFAATADNGTFTLIVDSNNVSKTDGQGIFAIARNSNCTLNTRITNNTVAAPATTNAARSGIQVSSGSAGGDVVVCSDIRNNTTAGSTNTATVTTAPGISIRKQGGVQAVNQFGIEGLSPSPATGPQAEAFVSGQNAGSAAGTFGTGGTASLSGNNYQSCSTAPNAPISAKALPQSGNASSSVAVVDTPAQQHHQFGLMGSAAENRSANSSVAMVTENVAAQSTQSQPSLISRAVTAFGNFASEVLSLVEPTAHASGNTEPASSVSQRITVAPQVAQATSSATGVSGSREAIGTTNNKSRKTVSHHATIKPRALAPTMAGETVTINIGTLRPSDSVVITFQVTVNNPPNLTGVPPAAAQVSNQGTVNYNDGATPLSTNTNTVNTPVDLFDTTTTLASDLNPSNFGDLVTFTATVAESPVQATADPTGTVDFIDTSNGNAVICDNVALSGGQAQCQTSTLTAGLHNIRADYSGDGNFDPSQSNIIAQTVNACTPNPIVTTTADSGAGSLRDAVAQVCSGTTITFNIPGAGPHTITLTTGELAATKNMTIKNNSGERITVSGNNASRVFNINSGKTVSIIGLTISGGNAASGAGIINDGALTVVNSTISGNSATSDGGGISTTATGTALTLINTTISGNSAAGSGGGVNVLGGTVSSINSTISNNTADSDNNSTGTGGGISASAGTTTLKNTIVAGNFNEDGASDAADDISGTVDAASSFNLIGTGGAGGLTNGVNNNQVGVASAGLGALADNGGLVNTHALLPTSPAVETGGNANLPADTFDLDGDANTAEALPVDGRGLGFPRNADSSDVDTIQVVDIGAFELHPSIEDILDQSTNEDTVKNVSFNIGDDTGSLIASVTATSSNTTLVPNANLVITGSGGSRNLQITPAANQSGTTTITVTVTATNGRTATDTFDLTVNAANDPPSGTDNTVSTAEDTTYTFTAADFGFTDPNDTPPNTFFAVKITTLPALGTLTNNNVPVNAGDFISVADINGGLLKFTPAPNGFGTPYTTFTFQVQDAGGGTDLDPTPNTMTINVTGVNDAPVNTVPGPQSTDEDVALVFSSGNGNQISVADSDAGANPIKITLTATNGTLTLSTTAGLSFITGDGTADATMMFTGTLTAVNTALNGMSFTGTANFSGAASLQIVSDDQGNTGTGGPLTDTDSVNITINAVNDPPSGTDNTVSTAEDTAYTFTAADFGFTDPNDTPPNTLQAVKITTLPGLGTLTNNNVAVNAGDFISVANINGGLLKFTPAADGNGLPYTTFTFQVQDNGGGTDLDPTPNTMTINVTAVNDGPVNTVPGPQSTTEDTPKVFSAANLNQISVADADAGSNPIKITLTATNGTITLSTTAGLAFITGDGTADATMMFTGTLTAVNTAMNGMSFNPTADFNGAASLQIVSDDQGNSGSGGPLTDTDTVNITVNAANDPPVVTTTVANLSYTENDPATAIDTGLTVTDVDSANLVGATVAITSGHVAAQDTLAFANQNGITGNYNSGSGVLTLSGSSSVANYQTALRSVTYQNSSDNPTASRTVTFIADDGSSTSTPATRGITINAVNDAPVNTVPGAQGTNQNTPLTFSSGNGNQISIADADAGTNAVQVTLTATNGTLTLNGTAGLAFTVGDGTADATMTFTGTIVNINTALNGMTFTPTLGFSGAATLTITTNDQGNSGSGGALSDTDVVNIQVSTNVSIQDASLVEPKNNTTANMIFTVTLSAPAPAGGSSVNFTTQQEAPALNHATAGQDYTTTAGTVNFAAGEQFKTILVPILGDNKNNEANETFLVVLSSPVNATIQDGTATGTILIVNNAGAILIGELRTSGPAGAGDDFVEIYNNSDSPHTVTATDGSSGYGLFKMGATCGATPVLVGFIPNGTVIPGRGHYLFAGPSYSLGAYGAADQTVADIESDRNVGIFSTSNLAAISSANRLDAVGFGANTGGNCDLLREGSTLTPLVGSVLEYSYFRDECGKKGNPSTFGPCPTGGATKDTNDNAEDLVFVETTGAVTVAGQRLGAPGPQGLGSPRKNDNVFTLLLDATVGSNGSPNRDRNNSISVPNGATGTLAIRRRFVNATGAPVTKLRFRIVDISALGTGATADLRAISSGPVTISGIQDSATCQASNGSPTTPCTIVVQGTTLDEPPNQPMGGALNSSWNAGTITLGTPLAPGASVNIQLVLGVQSSGSFKFFFNVEALP